MNTRLADITVRHILVLLVLAAVVVLLVIEGIGVNRQTSGADRQAQCAASTLDATAYNKCMSR